MSEDYFVPLKLKPRLREESGLGPAQLMIKDFESRSPPPVMQSAMDSRPMVGCKPAIPEMQNACLSALNEEVQRSRLLFESVPQSLISGTTNPVGGSAHGDMPLKESSPLASHSENLRTANEKKERSEKKQSDSSDL
jgi:hypothetical protein